MKLRNTGKNNRDLEKRIDKTLEKRIKKEHHSKQIRKNRLYSIVRFFSIISIILGSGFILNSLSLSTIGTGILLGSIEMNIRIGLTLILIGIFINIITIGNLVSKNIRDGHIILILISWIIALYFITQTLSLEIFSILILLGMLLIKESTDHITSKIFNLRMNVLISLFVIGFIVVMGKIIISV